MYSFGFVPLCISWKLLHSLIWFQLETNHALRCHSLLQFSEFPIPPEGLEGGPGDGARQVECCGGDIETVAGGGGQPSAANRVGYNARAGRTNMLPAR